MKYIMSEEEHSYLQKYNIKHYEQPSLTVDIAVFAVNETWTAGDWASKASNSPFAGWELPAPTVLTVCGGAIVFER